MTLGRTGFARLRGISWWSRRSANTHGEPDSNRGMSATYYLDLFANPKSAFQNSLAPALEVVPANETAAQQQKGLMHRGKAFIADVEPAKAMKPGERAFDHPAGPAESATVATVPTREDGRDAALPEFGAVRAGVIAAIALDASRLPARGPGATADGGNGVDERQQFADVVVVGRRQVGDDGDALRVGQNVMFRPVLTAIGWVRSSFFPPRGARNDALSTIARSRSSRPRRRSSVRRAWWMRRQTPACCQASNRRRQVLPEPQPISNGNIFHGIPLRRTKRIPVNTARSGWGLRPALWPRPRRRAGNNGSTRAHSASSTRGFDMADRTNSADQVQVG